LKQQELDDILERKRCLERQLADMTKSEKRRSVSIRNLSKMVEDLSAREAELKAENGDLQQVRIFLINFL